MAVGNAYLGSLAIDGCYLGNKEIQACYLGSTYIFPLTLPSVPFLVNYNAKRFSNGSIPQESGALVASALTVLNVTSHSDYLSFNGTAETVFDFGSDANNPFNITPSDLGLTIIAKTGRGVTTSGNLISNRGLNGTSKLNWMYRPAKSDDTFTFHTLDGSWDGNGYTLSAYPNIYAFRINPNDSNGGQYNSYTDGTSAATGQVSCQSTQSDKVVFFNGYPSSQTEHFTGDFYWIYVARTYLTDAEVQQVINYNENYIGKKISPKESPLTLEFLSSGNVSFNGFQEALTTSFDVECNINGGGWNSTSLYSSEGIDVVSGDTIQLRGGSINNAGYNTLTTAKTPYIVSTADFNAFGNVYSMISPENFAQVTNPSAKICQIFGYCSTLKSAENLYMGESDTTMVSNQFQAFFRESGIEKAPALPMVNAKTSCYENMFNGCTALTDSPVIAANNVTSSKCFKGMFSGCTSLSAVTCLATNVSASTTSTSPTHNWLKDVAANGTFTKSAFGSWLTNSPHGIPSGWNVVDI